MILWYLSHRRPAKAKPTGMDGDSGTNVRGNDFFSSPAVTGKGQASDITQIS